MAKYLYCIVFEWLVIKVNESLGGQSAANVKNLFIGVLDIYGFEHFQLNSFEQMTINYANERLHYQFN